MVTTVLGYFLDTEMAVSQSKAHIQLARVPVSIAVGDLNNDTYMDIACTNTVSHNIGLLFGNGNGSFTIQPPLSLENGIFPEYDRY